MEGAMSDCASTRRRGRYADMPVSEKTGAPSEDSESRSSRGRERSRLLLLLIIVATLIGLMVVGLAVYVFYQSYTTSETARVNQDFLRKLIRAVNDNKESTWKAKFNKFGVKNKSYGFKYTRNSTLVKEQLDYLKKFFDSDKMKNHIKELTDMKDEDLPKEFDARVRWPHCPSISNVPNQGGCGSCYAVASMGVASDRACIQSNATYKSLFSEEDVLGCCEVCGNCYGGDPLKALTYWVNEGLVTGGRDGCRPYSFDLQCGVPCSPATFPSGEENRKCVRKCQNIYYQNEYDSDKHFASIAYSMYPRSMTVSEDGKERQKVPTIIGHLNETAASPLSLDQIRTVLMKEIYLSGPTTMAFPVTEEFLHYHSGVFRPYPKENFNERVVYWHVVRLIGWGHEEDGSQHWLAVNSFGSHWGDRGVFRINTDEMEKFGLEYETALI